MRHFFNLLIQPNFMQGMLLAACLFLIPLKRRQGWQIRLASVCTLSLLAGTGLDLLAYLPFVDTMHHVLKAWCIIVWVQF